MMFLHVRLLNVIDYKYFSDDLIISMFIRFSENFLLINNLLIIFFFTEEFDAYIIVSFVNATLVLSIGETVEEVTESGFLGTTPTLSCSALGLNSLVQVFSQFHYLYIILIS